MALEKGLAGILKKLGRLERQTEESGCEGKSKAGREGQRQAEEGCEGEKINDRSVIEPEKGNPVCLSGLCQQGRRS